MFRSEQITRNFRSRMAKQFLISKNLRLDLVSQARTGLSALDLKRHLGVSCPTAWADPPQAMQAMAEHEDLYRLSGGVQMDDAYLGSERRGGLIF